MATGGKIGMYHYRPHKKTQGAKRQAFSNHKMLFSKESCVCCLHQYQENSLYQTVSTNTKRTVSHKKCKAGETVNTKYQRDSVLAEKNSSYNYKKARPNTGNQNRS